MASVTEFRYQIKTVVLSVLHVICPDYYFCVLSTGDSCRYMLSGSVVEKCRCANNEQCV